MTVHLPTEATIECDECGVEDMVDLVEFAGDPPSVGVLEDSLPEGWTVSLCPECNAELGDED